MSEIKKLLVAIDDSPQSNKAFDFALELATTSTGVTYEITALSVVHLSEQIDVPMDIEPILSVAKSQYEKLLTKLQEKAKSQGVTITAEIVIGHPAECLIEFAIKNQNSMIIMGQRGRSKISKWLMGSVSQQVANHAPCTVTIVK